MIRVKAYDGLFHEIINEPEREAVLAAGHEQAYRKRLAALGCPDDAALCAAIRDGSLDHRFGDVAEAVTAAAVETTNGSSVREAMNSGVATVASPVPNADAVLAVQRAANGRPSPPFPATIGQATAPPVKGRRTSVDRLLTWGFASQSVGRSGILRTCVRTMSSTR